MIKSTSVRCCSSPMLLEGNDFRRIRSLRPSTARFGTTICCSSSRSHSSIPKLEPFSRTKLDRLAQDPPLIQKAENELSDYCSTLEGDESYSCWRAYFELKDLEREAPKVEVENLILQAGGVKSLVEFVHGVSKIYKMRPSTSSGPAPSGDADRVTPVPDGLPKSEAELKEEESAKMPDSAFTRLLRARGKFPAWYSPAPDHETD